MKLELGVALVFLALASSGTLARSGFVATRDGRIFEGHLRFESNTIIVVNAEKEVWEQIGLTNLASLMFVDALPAAAAHNRRFAPLVELESGSAQRGGIDAMDDTAIYFLNASGKLPVSKFTVANVRFQPLPSRLAPILNAGRTGVLLSNGQFVDGDCRSIEKGRILLSSVPLGLCRYDVNAEVIAMVLRKRLAPLRPACEVKTTDGSVWLGRDLSLDQRGLLIREPIVGPRRISIYEILELRNGS